MDLDAVIERAVGFLLESRNSHGWWHDFINLAGTSKHWVTAYVAAQLVHEGGKATLSACKESWRMLQNTAREQGGWGYNDATPPDADSTIWALRLAEALGQGESIAARHAYSFLRKHKQSNGGYSTYAAEGEIRHFTELPPEVSFRGWCGSHICVSAAAATLVPGNFTSTCAMLRESQKLDGSWNGYWWLDDEYTTSLATEALIRENIGENESHINRAIDWAIGRFSQRNCIHTANYPTGSPFATGLGLRILTLGEPLSFDWNLVEKALEWLAKAQKEDGSWGGSALMRLPPPNVVDPHNYQNWKIGGRGAWSAIFDQNSNFTTATILSGICSLRSKADGKLNAI
ncbi:MAG: prenyltransferase/squalene oxidase repeat-containing protein [Candidatus Thorarchaeota archaeon]